jgi:DNA-binding transcriptional LysR family regulator
MTSLSVFTAAVEGGSMAAAARRHKITPAMAGRHIDSLERALKARLLQRTTRRLHLTDVGRAYYQRSRHILEEFDEAQREAGELQLSPQGSLKIAVPGSFAALHLGGPLARYMRDHPGIRVETVASDRYVDLIQEGIDVAVRIGRLPDSSLVARRVGTCRMVMCAAPAYLSREGEPKTPQELRKHPRLAFSESVSPGDWTLRDARGRSHVIDGPCHLLADNMQVLLAVALEESGIAYGPSFIFGEALYRGTLVRVLPRYSAADLGIHTVVPSSRYVSTKVRHLIDRLATEFGEKPPWDRWLEVRG